ncbi:Uncharacterised protein [Mycobacteroides abscessus subsp. abscessus]|nr:Uncharacterised protein [Mycobacteroides abscessus subsp. abscessus]
MIDADLRGLTLNVYRRSGGDIDCTLGGLTATHDRLTLIGYVTHGFHSGETQSIFRPSAWLVRQASAAAPPVVAIVRKLRSGVLAYLEPAPVIDNGAGRFVAVRDMRRRPVHGGNLAGTSDSRLAEILDVLLGHPTPDALRVHDRYES